MVGAVIVGAGEGARMGTMSRKQFMKVGGKPVIAYTLEVFEHSALVDHIVVVVPRDAMDWVKEEVVEAYGLKKIHAVVGGGETRQQSVFNGLKALKEKTAIVVIHDAVRPLVSDILIKRVIEAAKKTGAAISAVPARDTVKKVESGQIVGTLDRRLLWLAQTPQSFRYEVIMGAHKQAVDQRQEATDDASLVEAYGTGVVAAVGSYANLKITSPEDMPLFEYFLKQDNRARLHAEQRRKPGRPGIPGKPGKPDQSGRQRKPRQQGQQDQPRKPAQPGQPGKPRQRPPRGKRPRSRRRR
jgi:2-C-methyl-D-erythritol 4-phosphate cytidylyltransferase